MVFRAVGFKCIMETWAALAVLKNASVADLQVQVHKRTANESRRNREGC